MSRVIGVVLVVMLALFLAAVASAVVLFVNFAGSFPH
jgi:hypothetical protein